ncbi:MAG: ATP phosphoribosyltransferase regulatory subunit [Lachnospiraceae bacterium]|nr:ATP phosphoribosyltransferase regulatory subunit [Lachnospiraceae bacterium]MCI9657320.1 ATP phosphoribosyltransferase regulatory subunit [Lachnospiraceae bacterium]
MYKQILHTPEGVRDIYNEECRRKNRVQELMHNVLSSYGYEDIQTPTFEFFDVFSREVGTVPSRELFKFFDREGNTLVLRPDITPSIARAVAKYFTEEDMPVRLCYVANTFINHSDLQGRLKENTQLGAELIGDGSVEADAELMALVAESLLKAGLSEFQVSIGHVDFFKSLLREAGLDEEMELELRELISNKNIYGVRELLEPIPVSAGLKEAFAALPNLFGSVDVLERADACAVTEDARRALDRLRKIYDLLVCYGYEKYITFDLGVVSKYRYYTGIIFQAYTYGTGEPVAKGGRYDTLMDHFGKPAPATGVAFVIDRLMSALSRQKVKTDEEVQKVMIVYRASQAERAIKKAVELRKAGRAVELLPERIGKDYEAYAEKNGIREILYTEEEGTL